MKNNSLPERHRILQRSSNITVNGRRQNVKCYDGIRFITNAQHDPPNSTQESRLQKGSYHQCMDYLQRQDEPPQQQRTQLQGKPVQLNLETPLNDNSNRVVPTQKLIPESSDVEHSRPKVGLTKRYYDRLSDYSEVQDRIKLISSKMSNIRDNIRSRPTDDYTFIRQTLQKERDNDRVETQPAEVPLKSQFLRPTHKRQKQPDDIDSSVSNQQPNPKQRKEVTVSTIQSFVTQEPEPLKMIHCSSQNNLRSPRNKLSANQHIDKYYISTIMTAYTDEANTSFMQLCRSHLHNCLIQLRGAKRVIKPQDHEVPEIRRLPKSHKKHTLVFDLDETLVHCNQKPDMPCDVVLKLRFNKPDPIKVGVNIRPYAQECLKELSEYYELVLFTASHEIYANAVADYLDPQRQFFSFRYFRQSCFRTADGYIKDLRLIDRPLNNMLLIDNAAYSYAFHLENGVPIIPFYDCKTDCELRHLCSYLKEIHTADDLLKEHCRMLQCHLYEQFELPEQLLRLLYHIKLS